jgi:hypothetical protein
MPTAAPSATFLARHTQILKLIAHRRDRGELWRRVVKDRGLSEAERVDLLEMIRIVARYPVTVDADAMVSRMTGPEPLRDRLDSETEGGLDVISAEQADEMLSKPGAIEPRGDQAK